MYTVKAYLCNKVIPVIEFGQTPASQISIENRIIQAKMLPIGKNFMAKTMQVRLISETSDLVACLTEGAELTWERRAIVFGGEFAGLETLITIEGSQPGVPCIWQSSILYGVRLSPFDHNLIMIMTPTPVIGNIPDSKDDVCLLSDTFSSRSRSTDIIPGELLNLVWRVKVGGSIHSLLAKQVWFDAPAFTGGKILEKIEEEGSDNSYLCSVIGSQWPCMATDWADYPSEQWGFILKQGFSEAERCGRTETYESSQQTFTFRLIPITVNGYGVASTSLETRDYNPQSSNDEFTKFYETSLHTGIILDVDDDEDIADVTVKKLGVGQDEEIDYEGVEIFYHCEGETGVAGGRAAFAVGDEVLILNEGGNCHPDTEDLCIVGFPEEVKPCNQNLVLVFLHRDHPNKTTGNAIFLEIDPSGNVTEKAVKNPLTGQALSQPFYTSWWNRDTPAGKFSIDQVASYNKLTTAKSGDSISGIGGEGDYYNTVENPPPIEATRTVKSCVPTEIGDCNVLTIVNAEIESSGKQSYRTTYRNPTETIGGVPVVYPIQFPEVLEMAIRTESVLTGRGFKEVHTDSECENELPNGTEAGYYRRTDWDTEHHLNDTLNYLIPYTIQAARPPAANRTEPHALRLSAFIRSHHHEIGHTVRTSPMQGAKLWKECHGYDTDYLWSNPVITTTFLQEKWVLHLQRFDGVYSQIEFINTLYDLPEAEVPLSPKRWESALKQPKLVSPNPFSYWKNAAVAISHICFALKHGRQWPEYYWPITDAFLDIEVYHQGNRPLMAGSSTEYHFDLGDFEKVLTTEDILTKLGTNMDEIKSLAIQWETATPFAPVECAVYRPSS